MGELYACLEVCFVIRVPPVLVRRHLPCVQSAVFPLVDCKYTLVAKEMHTYVQYIGFKERCQFMAWGASTRRALPKVSGKVKMKPFDYTECNRIRQSEFCLGFDVEDLAPVPISHLGEAAMFALKLSGKESHSKTSTRKDRFDSSRASLNNENQCFCSAPEKTTRSRSDHGMEPPSTWEP